MAANWTEDQWRELLVVYADIADRGDVVGILAAWRRVYASLPCFPPSLAAHGASLRFGETVMNEEVCAYCQSRGYHEWVLAFARALRDGTAFPPPYDQDCCWSVAVRTLADRLATDRLSQHKSAIAVLEDNCPARYDAYYESFETAMTASMFGVCCGTCKSDGIRRWLHTFTRAVCEGTELPPPFDPATCCSRRPSEE